MNFENFKNFETFTKKHVKITVANMVNFGRKFEYFHDKIEPFRSKMANFTKKNGKYGR